MSSAQPNPQAPPSKPTDITVVESDTCHFCEDAHDVLGELASRFPLRVTSISLTTDSGKELMATHRAGMSPLILMDGAFFSQGRLPRRKLTKALTKRYGTLSEPAAQAVS